MSDETREKSEAAAREEATLNFWNEKDIFKKTLTKHAPKGDFLFYDGPPFASGLPHYGHILASAIKDAIPRFRTMQGYRVPRQWGWDCHGLPVENLVERELGLKTKRDIEEYGIAKFNEAARVSIMKDVDAWKRIIPRIGRWADMKHDYKTMDASYTESVWWAFKTLWQKGLVEKSFKAMHLCPHCGTTLSNFEVSQGYKDIQDLSVTVKLELKDEPGTFLLAWTTTPWTLPGNMAAAVNPSFTYVLAEKEGARYIVARDRMAALGEHVEVVREFSGKELVGKAYTPPFSYYAASSRSGTEKAWKVYAGEFVTAEDGTGIVHIAPGFGEDDLTLAKKEGIPVVHHVDTAGKFVSEVADFAGTFAKPKENHQAGDIEIIKNLAHRGLLFAKEKITHSYPHCWRCDTPLLNYASTSWFVKVPHLKEKLVAENKKVSWVPESVGTYRFGNWLEGARDWAISRSRFWGAPLPIWEAKDGERMVIGSKEELSARIQTSGNRYFVVRHGEAESNAKNIYSSDIHAQNPLTTVGVEHAKRSALALKGTRIDMVIASPYPRTKHTAEIFCDALGIPHENIVFDERLKEVQYGVFDGKPRIDSESDFTNSPLTFTSAPEGGETLDALKKRVRAALYDFEKTYQDKHILIVSHGGPIWFMRAATLALSPEETLSRRIELYPKNATVYELPLKPLPMNTEWELDYHRPYIDEVVLTDESGKEYRRVPEVFDCWFESGSMPFASTQYPTKTYAFNPKRWFGFGAQGYPADFIAEGLDQTRGWFYSLIVLGVALFGKSPYKHVIVNGLVLAEDGQKMSKRLKNYPDPLDVVNSCGADALRFYLLSSPVVRGEDLNFSFKGVEEVQKKHINRVQNVLAFYALYARGEKAGAHSTHVLDRWILARLRECARETTAGYESYALDAALRPLPKFIDDLSTWYLRRSRERIKEGGVDAALALATLRYVLRECALLMAPAMPFFAEHVYQAVKEVDESESVHLASWSSLGAPDASVITHMEEARTLVSLALEERERAKIPIRQPLGTLTVRGGAALSQELLTVVAEEVNVKRVVHAEHGGVLRVELDTLITPELQREGDMREVVRAGQEARKALELKPSDTARAARIELPERMKESLSGTEEDVARTLKVERVVYDVATSTEKPTVTIGQ